MKVSILRQAPLIYMSIILGLNTFHAGSSACIVVDGIPLFAVAEERLNRKKYYAGGG